ERPSASWTTSVTSSAISTVERSTSLPDQRSPLRTKAAANRFDGPVGMAGSGGSTEGGVYGTFVRLGEAQAGGDAGQHLVGEELAVPGEREQLHLVHAEVGEDRQVPGGQHHALVLAE